MYFKGIHIDNTVVGMANQSRVGERGSTVRSVINIINCRINQEDIFIQFISLFYNNM